MLNRHVCTWCLHTTRCFATRTGRPRPRWFSSFAMGRSRMARPDAIRNLVASAVDGLGADHVVLVDASGRLPLGPKTREALQLSGEQALEEKLISTLEPVTGAGNVRASVTLDYDPDALRRPGRTTTPTQSATLSMERSEQTTGGQPVAAGVPGTASNAPNSQSLPVYPR